LSDWSSDVCSSDLCRSGCAAIRPRLHLRALQLVGTGRALRHQLLSFAICPRGERAAGLRTTALSWRNDLPLVSWPNRGSRVARADLVIAVSETLASHLTETGVNSTHVQVLPNGVDARWLMADGGLDARKHTDLENCFVIGFVGSFKPWHGADFLLAAFEDFHRIE